MEHFKIRRNTQNQCRQIVKARQRYAFRALQITRTEFDLPNKWQQIRKWQSTKKLQKSESDYIFRRLI